MKAKNQRLTVLLASLACVGLSVCLVLYALSDNITFFYTPKDLAEKHIPPHQKIRIGGMVEKGSVSKNGLQVDFSVTDFEDTLRVRYVGVLPDLFREGQGVVADGVLNQDGTFTAESILAKHDENYMPPELADIQKGRS